MKLHAYCSETNRDMPWNKQAKQKKNNEKEMATNKKPVKIEFLIFCFACKGGDYASCSYSHPNRDLCWR